MCLNPSFEVVIKNAYPLLGANDMNLYLSPVVCLEQSLSKYQAFLSTSNFKHTCNHKFIFCLWCPNVLSWRPATTFYNDTVSVGIQIIFTGLKWSISVMNSYLKKTNAKIMNISITMKISNVLKRVWFFYELWILIIQFHVWIKS